VTLSVIVLHLDDIGVAPLPSETNAPLVIDTNAPLTFAVTAKLFQAVGRRYAQEVERVRRIQRLQLDVGAAMVTVAQDQSVGLRLTAQADSPIPGLISSFRAQSGIGSSAEDKYGASAVASDPLTIVTGSPTRVDTKSCCAVPRGTRIHPWEAG
jgi:hypothetical protein